MRNNGIFICLAIILNAAFAEEIKFLRPKVPHKKIKPRIIGGTEAVPHAYPYQVGIFINRETNFCGGTLISKNYVLTAAHCAIRIIDPKDTYVLLGAHNLTRNETTQKRVEIEDFLIHDLYSSQVYRNDIALIKLKNPAEFSYAIQTVDLPDADKLYENIFTVATGWGMVFDGPSSIPLRVSSILRVVTVPIMNTEVCTEYYNDDVIYVSGTNLCTSGYRNKGTCNGDSGGPLVYNGVLIGVTSFGPTKCEECYPSVYTKVGSYLDWIRNNSDVKKF